MTTRHWLTGLFALTLATGCHGGEPTEEEAHKGAVDAATGDFTVTASAKPALNGSRSFGVTVGQADGNTASGAASIVSIDTGTLVLPPEACEAVDARSAKCYSNTRSFTSSAGTAIPPEEIEFGVDATGPVVVKINVPTIRDIDGITTTIDPNPANNTTTITLPAPKTSN